jgi:hypothetical protein
MTTKSRFSFLLLYTVITSTDQFLVFGVGKRRKEVVVWNLFLHGSDNNKKAEQLSTKPLTTQFG